jgi:SAM-dependent methyltransferase
MDDIARYNLRRWQALADANALFTRPHAPFTNTEAREWLDPSGRLEDVAGRAVLCLASGGGQQSAAFAALGAAVTVVDLSDAQLERDRAVAVRDGATIETVQADMRDLTALAAGSFDLVWQPYSLNFVPEARAVFAQVVRVLKPGGVYRVSCANPFVAGLTERDWNGQGYTLRDVYADGAAITYPDQSWVHDAGSAVPWPREFRHTLSTLVNGLVAAGFALEHLEDAVDVSASADAEPGTWDHFTAVAPPWLAFWARLSSGAIP